MESTITALFGGIVPSYRIQLCYVRIGATPDSKVIQKLAEGNQE